MLAFGRKTLHWEGAGNHIVMVLMAVMFALQFGYDPGAEYLDGLVLQKIAPQGLFGYMWLHMDIIHIVSNILMLWIFGEYVCSKIGNGKFFISYLALGIAAGVVHCVFDGRAAIGSSGAIMGVLGMCVVLCFRKFSAAGPWLILAWYLLNVFVGVAGVSPTAHLSHVGGFIAGVILAGCFVFFNMVDSEDTCKSLLVLLRRI